jgi:hypothetical protein
MSENKTAKTPTDDGHVAHVYLFEKTGRPMVAWDNAKDIKLGDRLYAAPKQWVGLTDEDMEALFLNEDGVRFARYIEAKLREKNGGEYRNGATTERTKLNQENT